MPPWASWSGFPLPGSEMTLPGMSAVWDQVRGHRGLRAPRVLTPPSTLCRGIPKHQQQSPPWTVVLRGSHFIPDTLESALSSG